jgi:nucleoside-diphosphate-sugar epimerase
MAIVITGGYGLMGSWLAFEFAQNGEDVFVVDVVNKDHDYLGGAKNRITYFHASVLDFPRLAEIFQKHRGKIEGIIHTVSVMATPEFWSNPHNSVHLNVMGTLNLLETARQHSVKRFLYVSSGAVYGELEENASELTHPLHPSDLYGASKASAEMIGQEYAHHYGLDFRCVRPYFFFGPGRLPSEQTFLFRNLLGSLEGLQGLRLEKGADQKLGFTYVKDIARGAFLVYKAQNLKHKTVNIASQEPVSFPELARLAQKYSDTPSQVYIGKGKLFARAETLDITLAREELGFVPRYAIEDAVREYAQWIKRNKQKARK